MDIITILKDLWKTKDLQQWVNNRYQSDRYKIVDKKHVKGLFTNFGYFTLDSVDTNIFEEIEDYCYEDLRVTDIVLDIGANIGAYSLKIEKLVDIVYAVEPLFYEKLTKNIDLNNSKIKTLPYCLGEDKSITYRGVTTKCKGKSLKEIIDIVGGKVDFLKCDCEGGEWCIKPSEITGIRRIEMEVHSFNGENKYDMVKMLENNGYQVYFADRSNKTMMIHAFKK